MQRTKNPGTSEDQQALMSGDEPQYLETFDYEIQSEPRAQRMPITKFLLKHEDDKNSINTNMKPLERGGDGSLEGFVRDGAVAQAHEVLNTPSKINRADGRGRQRRLTIVGANLAKN